jgi:hypothetical protein
MMDLLGATQNGEICSQAFDYFGPGPDGSINLAVTEQLTIPVITVGETYLGRAAGADASRTSAGHPPLRAAPLRHGSGVMTGYRLANRGFAGGAGA